MDEEEVEELSVTSTIDFSPLQPFDPLTLQRSLLCPS